MAKTLNVIEQFKSLQGEGIHSGFPTFFIRLAGCNLRCSYCDTKYAYGAGIKTNIKTIIKNAQSQGINLICLTGGEPLNQKECGALVEELLRAGFYIDIETNGSKSLAKFPNSSKILYSLDIKCPSSLMDKKMNFNNLRIMKKKDQVKFIIKSRKDYNFSKNIINKYKLLKQTNIIFTPVGGVKADKLATWILRDNLPVRVGLQMHKIIWRSEKKAIASQNIIK